MNNACEILKFMKNINTIKDTKNMIFKSTIFGTTFETDSLPPKNRILDPPLHLPKLHNLANVLNFLKFYKAQVLIIIIIYIRMSIIY